MMMIVVEFQMNSCQILDGLSSNFRRTVVEFQMTRLLNFRQTIVEFQTTRLSNFRRQCCQISDEHVCRKTYEA